MPKDSQIDKKSVRKEKSKGKTTIAEENHQNSKNAKKQSTRSNDV